MTAIDNVLALSKLILPSWGGPLTPDDYAALSQSWITADIADAAMLRRVDSEQGRAVVCQKGKRDCTGILIPYYWPDDPSPFSYRLRRDKTDLTLKHGKVKKNAKYLGAPGAANRIYILPGVTAEQLADVRIPIAIVEGEKKALALWRLACHESEHPRFIPIAIAGVWNWKGTIGKTGGPNGERLDVKGPIADLSRIAWSGRQTFVVFDVNVHTNESVQWARKGLSRELATRAADVKLVNLPEHCGVNGIDDLLVKWGPDKVIELFDGAVSGARLQVTLPPQFQSGPDGLIRVIAKGQSVSREQLTNFSAEILTDIKLDDGVETTREFEIRADLLGRALRFTVPASDFASMDWVLPRMGSTAIVFPSKRDYARAAIQSLSLTATEKCVYTHTGWRNVGGGWVYLHAGGAVGAGGPVSGVNVRLHGALGSYTLELASDACALTAATAATLRLVELGPPSVSFPLLAATFRAVFGSADFSLHVVGETGAFKSELAALHQQFFGADMNRLNLPGNWSSTANALETSAFHAKDALFVIDDFAPQGNGVDVARYHAGAERVFRSAGNHAGRGRLDSAAKLREQKPPRALILSTGEDVPKGHSVRARLLILEIAKGNIKGDNLAECQRAARAGLYAESMAGFLQWFAARHEETRAEFGARVSEYRAKALSTRVHARTPDIVASLQASFDLFLQFAVAVGALDVLESGRLADRCWAALGEATVAQGRYQGESEPAARFLVLLQSVLSSGRAHLKARSGGAPDQGAESCGWRRDGLANLNPLGDCIGWIDADDVYLESGAAFRVVQVAARDVGDAFPISEQTLRKRLREKGLLASTDTKRGTLTVRRAIRGSSKDVLHFHRSTLLPEAREESEEDLG